MCKNDKGCTWEGKDYGPGDELQPGGGGGGGGNCPGCPASVAFTDVLRDNGKYNKFIEWTDVSYESGYRIYRCREETCSIPLTPPAGSLVTTVGANITSYTDTNNNNGFASGTILKYEIRPYRFGCPTLNCTDHTNYVGPTPTPTTTLTPTPTLTPRLTTISGCFCRS